MLITLIILKYVLQTVVAPPQNAVLALCSLPRNATMSLLSATKCYNESQPSAPGERVLTRSQPCQHSDLELLASRSMRNQVALLIRYPHPPNAVLKKLLWERKLSVYLQRSGMMGHARLELMPFTAH